MKITIESTTKIVQLKLGPDFINYVPARIWEGTTESGIKVHCFITRIATDKNNDCSEFERELQEHKAPSTEIMSFPNRLIL